MLASLDFRKKMLLIYIGEMVILLFLFLLLSLYFPPNKDDLGIFIFCTIAITYFSAKIIQSKDTGIAIYCICILCLASTLFQLSIYAFPLFFFAVLPLTRIYNKHLRFIMCSIIILLTVSQAIILGIFSGYIAVFVLGIITTLLVETTYVHQLKQKHDLILGAEKINLLAKNAERERVAEDLSKELLDVFDTIEELGNDAISNIEKKNNETEESIKNIQRLTRETLSKVRRIVVNYRLGTIQRVLQDGHSQLTNNGISLEITQHIHAIKPEIESHLAEIITALFNIIASLPGCRTCQFDIRILNSNIVCTLNTDGASGIKKQDCELTSLLKQSIQNGSIDFRENSTFSVVVTLPLNNVDKGITR
ncbi:sensor histidine kinase [Photobacterium alginatilyticum]|uniref:Signal transduction histidine kinase subgroup 3 dimerisation and phosphoacceptor domain-containing protein n=1 Tax=Photobacterium alginatilyticum TaxID=1775171 RepID=A0ABW9YFB6_9GAMM|nr:hypothetical protein [Photobacterium alginatilyticum]NBI52482.1 hypothetical protein [Photobacterium alginatilyticum]